MNSSALVGIKIDADWGKVIENFLDKYYCDNDIMVWKINELPCMHEMEFNYINVVLISLKHFEA